MDAARARCEASGERWTEPRRRVYELLLQAGRPTKAYDLIARYRAGRGGVAAPPTIYRALDFLLAHGLVHRLESQNAFIASKHGAPTHPAPFLICEGCGRAEELDIAVDQLAGEAAAARGFTFERAVFEIVGRCPDCR
jgi:Fur family zinc uptake transcriptional regulator